VFPSTNGFLTKILCEFPYLIMISPLSHTFD
jgi:hypothetical protein